MTSLVHQSKRTEPPAADPAAGSYFVATYPPFSTWRADAVCDVRAFLGAADTRRQTVPLGLYVHVPFCAHRCDYCYYLSYAGRNRSQMDSYVDAVVRELAAYRESPFFSGRRLDFVYFGGGTPSLLTTRSVRRFLAELRAAFPWDGAEEVTFECAPRSVTTRKLRALRDAGVNRVSLGLQQLDDAVLERNGRIHRVADCERAFRAIRRLDFDEVNVDLIAGLRGETDVSFRRSLDCVIDWRPDSVTIYQLETPFNTPLARSLRAGKVADELPTWPTKRRRLDAAFARLEEHGYPIRSAYAAARPHRHRRFAYQVEQYHGADLLGIGVSSFSYLAGRHFQNSTSLKEYVTTVEAGSLPISRAYVLSDEERIVREFVLQLKLGRVDAEEFRRKFGIAVHEQFAEPLEALSADGLLSFDPHGVTLTRRGLLQVDQLIPAFYLPQHCGVRYS